MEKTQHNAVAEKAPEKKRHYSIGERTFDFTVYGLMNWVGTFIITVPVAWALQYSKFAAPTFNKIAGKLEKVMPGPLGAIDKVLSPIRKIPPASAMSERAESWAKNILISTTTMQGGNLMLIPIKMAEQRKVKIVSSINRMFGDKADPASIEEAPKQTWGSLIKSRLSAFGLVFLTFTAASSAVPQTFRAFSEEFGHKLAKWFRSTPYDAKLDPKLLEERAVLRTKFDSGNLGVKEELKKIQNLIEGHETKAFQMGKIASWDTIATTAAVILLYIGSRFFAKKIEEKKKHSDAGPANNDTKQPTTAASLQQTNQPKVNEQPTEKPRAEVMARSISAESARTNAPVVSI